MSHSISTRNVAALTNVCSFLAALDWSDFDFNLILHATANLARFELRRRFWSELDFDNDSRIPCENSSFLSYFSHCCRCRWCRCYLHFCLFFVSIWISHKMFRQSLSPSSARCNESRLLQHKLCSLLVNDNNILSENCLSYDTPESEWARGVVRKSDQQ